MELSYSLNSAGSRSCVECENLAGVSDVYKGDIFAYFDGRELNI